MEGGLQIAVWRATGDSAGIVSSSSEDPVKIALHHLCKPNRRDIEQGNATLNVPTVSYTYLLFFYLAHTT